MFCWGPCAASIDLSLLGVCFWCTSGVAAGDIALAIGPQFAKYLPFAMPMLQSASELTCQQGMNDAVEELVDYNNQLRAGIFEAYAGIFVSFMGNSAQILGPYAQHILAFIENVAQDKERSEPRVSDALNCHVAFALVEV